MSQIVLAEPKPLQPTNFGLEQFADLPDPIRSQLTVLLTFLHTVGRYVLNRDAIWLALDDAKSLCRGMGVPDEHIETAVKAYWEHTGRVRKTNPMHRMYSDQ